MSQYQKSNEPGHVGLVPFFVIWPIIQFLAVPLLRAVLPYILEQIADALKSGQPIRFNDDDLKAVVEEQQQAMKAAYQQ